MSKKISKKKLRVLIAPVEIAGYYGKLNYGFKEIGVSSRLITPQSHKFKYDGADAPPLLIRMLRRLRRSPGRYVSFNKLLNRCEKTVWAIWAITALFRYDVFIFGFGRSLLPRNVDMVLLKLMRKRIIVNLAHGSEARPPYMNGYTEKKEGQSVPARTLNSATKIVANRVRRNEKWSSIVVGAPLSTSYFCRNAFINQFSLGLPFQGKSHFGRGENGKAASKKFEKPVRILHSPSRPLAKGSKRISRAIEDLRSRGHKIDYVVVQDQPHEVVLDEIKKCDFVVDQLYSDTPMAGFAVEAAWHGKPAVVGGNGFECLRNWVPEEMWPPSKLCHPNHIEKAIQDLICNRVERESIGRDAQAFVREEWHAKKVAKKYLQLIHGDIPESWWVEPDEITYLAGAGQPIEETRDNIRDLVSKEGVQSLQLSHRPALEKALLRFSEADSRSSNNRCCVE